MTPDEQVEHDRLKQELRQTQALLKQEEGKRIAVERDSYETKRQAKLTEEQANAYRQETDKALLEGAEQMRVALGVSQGIWAFGHMARTFMARKVAAARVVHREQENCLLMQQVIDAHTRGDQGAIQSLCEKMAAVISIVKGDGEAARLQAAEAALAYGIKEFGVIFDKLVQANPGDNNGQAPV